MKNLKRSGGLNRPPEKEPLNVESRHIVCSLGFDNIWSFQIEFKIAIYLIPEKLVIECNKEKEGLLSGRDLSLLAGVALDTPILKVRMLVTWLKLSGWPQNVIRGLLTPLTKITVIYINRLYFNF